MKLRPAVFTKNNPHYQQEQKAPWEGRENRTVRTKWAQVLPKAAPDNKMPSSSLKKGAPSSEKESYNTFVVILWTKILKNLITRA